MLKSHQETKITNSADNHNIISLIVLHCLMHWPVLHNRQNTEANKVGIECICSNYNEISPMASLVINIRANSTFYCILTSKYTSLGLNC